MFTRHFTAGVTNFRKVSLLMKKQQESEEPAPDTFEACEILIDDNECNSCSVCNNTELGLFSADCTNIVDGATITCDDVDSFSILDRTPSALTLDEGTEFPVEVLGSSSGGVAKASINLWMGTVLAVVGIISAFFQ
jgi:hypothetical protein